MCVLRAFVLFFFNDTAPPEIYTLSLHDALPICLTVGLMNQVHIAAIAHKRSAREGLFQNGLWRSEEHTSELQSRPHLVCRLLLEKKKTTERLDYALDPHHPVPHLVARPQLCVAL